MILLDTNVISEQMRARPAPSVMRWFDDLGTTPLFLSAITEAELWSGLAAMPQGKTRAAKALLIEQILDDIFADRILPFGSAAARAYGPLYQARKKLNGKEQELDCQIAAIAQINSLHLATRNTPDFEGFGLELINPWEHR